MKKSVGKDLMDEIFGNPKFRGKHVIVVGREIFVAADGKRAGEILEEVHKKYPKETPAITYIPKADTLILWLR